MLAGSSGDRLPEGIELVRRRIAPVLYVSDGVHETARGFCGRTRPYRVVCLRPKPYSTRGEAETVARVAAKRGWRRVVVVTSEYHVRRARMLFDRCLGSGRVAVVGTRPSLPRFALGALLDAGRSGVVLSAIQGRDYARIYVKELDRGRPSVALSPEEEEAVERAMAG